MRKVLLFIAIIAFVFIASSVAPPAQSAPCQPIPEQNMEKVKTQWRFDCSACGHGYWLLCGEWKFGLGSKCDVCGATGTWTSHTCVIP